MNNMSIIEIIQSSPSSIFTKEDILKLLNDGSYQSNSSVILTNEVITPGKLIELMNDYSGVLSNIENNIATISFDKREDLKSCLEEIENLNFKAAKKLITEHIISNHEDFISQCIDISSVTVDLSLTEHNYIETNIDMNSICLSKNSLKDFINEI